ncbi:MAG: NAD(P)-dependent oxidoreductase [Chitinophagaceae bacterium]
MKKKILITGGTGYLGSHIINALKGYHDFILLTRKSSRFHRLEASIHRIQVIDLEDFDQQKASVLEIDIFIHCATQYGKKDADAVSVLEANLMLPLRILGIFQRIGKKITYINTDTILEKHISAYSLSKSQLKEWMPIFLKDVAFINVKLEHFYGPLDDKSKFVSFIMHAFMNNQPAIDLTRGEQTRYFTFIDDIVSAFEVIIAKIDQFPTGLTEFEVSGDQPVTIKRFISLVQQITGNNITKLNFGAIPYRNGEVMNVSIDTTGIKKLGWRAKVDLTDGLKQTFETDKRNL